MRKWVREQIAAPEKLAMPVLSFPGVQMTGVNVGRLVRDSDAQVEVMRTVSRRIPSAAAVSLMDLSVEAECFGAKVTFPEYEVPVVTGVVVDGEQAAQALAIPTTGTGRAAVTLETARRVTAVIQDRPVFAGIIGPFSLSGRLMDVTEIMLACYDIPNTVHSTLEKVTSFLTVYCKAFKQAGANGVIMAEPLAGLLSPELSQEFSCYYVKKIINEVQDDNFIVIYHNCGGTVSAMTSELFSLGASGYHFGNAVTMKEILESCPNNVLCMGNIDPAQFVYGTPNEIYSSSLELMEECCPKYSNFIISSGCDIPPQAKWENIDAFFKAVDAFYARHSETSLCQQPSKVDVSNIVY